jgi:putative copper export protein
MVAPVVLITVGGILVSGLLAAYTTVADRMFGLNREQLGILTAQDGGLLHEDEVSAGERERLDQIRDQMPLIARRVRRIRNAAVLFSCSVGLLVLSVVVIGVAVTAGSKAFAFAALGLVLAGTAAEFAGIVTVTALVVTSPDALMYETRRTGDLAKRRAAPVGES